jgi:hypothetical protein
MVHKYRNINFGIQKCGHGMFINKCILKIPMSNMTMVDKTQGKETSKLSEQARNNLSELDLELVTSSEFFKPEPEKTYVIRINPENKVSMVKNPKFADKDGYIPTRFEFKITHPNNGVSGSSK